MPCATYEGREPYIFVSYAHRDSVRVLPILEALQAVGFRIWFDAGIEAGAEWPEYIAQRLVHCTCVLAFMSEAARDSHNCRREINYAIHKGIDPLVVYLEDVVLPPGMEMQLGLFQAIFRSRFADDRSFIDALARARLLQPCLGAAPDATGYLVREVLTDALPESEKVPESEKEPLPETDTPPEDAFKAGLEALNARRYDEAFRCFTAAAAGGHAGAMSKLAWHYKAGRGVATDYTMAAHWYRAAAELGDLDSMKELAWHYEIGSGVKMDPAEAVRWYRKAAEGGHAAAMELLARCYAQGQGMAKDPKMAIYWYRKAAAKGRGYSRDRLQEMGYDTSVPAICERGKALYVAKEYDEAFDCFRIGADQGHSDAWYYLGKCYYTGRGVEQNQAEAVRWYSAAANKGHADAQYALGFCYAHGAGVKQSHSMAFMWYKKAAEAGHTAAINNVAWRYAYGGAAGVKRNKEEAIRLFLINANRGDQYAIRQLQELGYKF